jgi:hypothetical protein
MRSAAKVISIVFHPLLLTTYLVLSLGVFFPAILGINSAVLYLFTLFIFVITFVFPALNIVLMVKISGSPASLGMASRRERLVPFVFISCIYMATAYLFYYKAVLGMSFIKLMVIIAVLVVVATVITFFYKISVHSLAMAGFIGILLPMNRSVGGALLLPTVVVIVVAGVVMSSRLLLNAHTLREVLSGACIGLAVGLAGMVLLF